MPAMPSRLAPDCTASEGGRRQNQRPQLYEVPSSDAQLVCAYHTGQICMNVSLTSQLERLVNEKFESGLYQTVSDVVVRRPGF